MAAFYLADADMPESYMGPVSAVRVPGMGRGLEATRTVAAGELLMICSPLAVVQRIQADEADEDGGGYEEVVGSEGELGDEGAGGGEEGAVAEGEGDVEEPTDEEIEALQVQLERRLTSPRLQAWLAVLDNGTPERLAQLPDMQRLSCVTDSSSCSSSSSSSGGGSSGGGASAGEDAEHLADLLDLHYQLLEEERLLLLLRWRQAEAALTAAASAAAGDTERRAAAAAVSAHVSLPPPRRTTIGLWPEYTLVNHSCTPNVSAFAMGGKLFVHAARSIAKQGQLLASYLPPAQLLAPLAVRQRVLKEEFGFECRCSRCREEAKLDRNLQQLACDVHEAADKQVATDLLDAWQQGGTQQLEDIRDQLAAYIEVLDAAFSKLGLKPRCQAWVQASVFRLYELTALALELLGDSDPRLLELLAALAGATAPGSSAHTYWARQYRRDVVAGAEEDQVDGGAALRHADGVAFAAHVARYGRQACGRLVHRRLVALADDLEAGDT